MSGSAHLVKWDQKVDSLIDSRSMDQLPLGHRYNEPCPLHILTSQHVADEPLKYSLFNRLKLYAYSAVKPTWLKLIFLVFLLY